MVSERATAESLKSLITTMRRAFRSGDIRYGTVTYVYPDGLHAAVLVDGSTRYVPLSLPVSIDDVVAVWQPPTTGRSLEMIRTVGTSYGGMTYPTYSIASAHGATHGVFGSDPVAVLSPTSYKILALDGEARYPKSALENVLEDGQSAVITLAKLTPEGSNGSLTFAGGILTTYVNPT